MTKHELQESLTIRSLYINLVRITIVRSLSLVIHNFSTNLTQVSQRFMVK